MEKRLGRRLLGISVVFFCLLSTLLFISCMSQTDDTKETAGTEKVNNTHMYTASPGEADIMLTLGIIGEEPYLEEAVVSFENDNPRIRISIIDYNEAGGEDQNAAMQLLKGDIRGGRGPDMFLIRPAFSAELARMGAFENLYSYLDNDLAIERSSFSSSMLKGAEINGGLYSFAPLFYVITARGRSDAVGSEKRITYEKIRAALGELPEGSALFTTNISGEEFLRRIYQVSGNSFFDQSSGQPDFDCDEFISALEFAALLPDEGGDRNPRKSVLEIMSIKSIHAAGSDGESYTYTGLPVSGSMKSGSAILFASGELAISSASENKQAAWSFVRTFFEEQTQLEMARTNFLTQVSFLPTNMNALSKMAEATISPKGDFYVKGQKDITLEETELLLDFIKSVENVYRDNLYMEDDYLNPVEQIIIDGAKPFIEGEISAHQAAVEIQNNVREYAFFLKER